MTLTSPEYFTDSVIGVTLFGDSDPIEFAVFDRAFVALFQITCGATWVTNLPVGVVLFLLFHKSRIFICHQRFKIDFFLFRGKNHKLCHVLFMKRIYKLSDFHSLYNYHFSPKQLNVMICVSSSTGGDARW